MEKVILQNLCSYDVTQLHYQIKQTQFSDEIKIQLPLYLPSNHHLLLTSLL